MTPKPGQKHFRKRHAWIGISSHARLKSLAIEQEKDDEKPVSSSAVIKTVATEPRSGLANKLADSIDLSNNSYKKRTHNKFGVSAAVRFFSHERSSK